MDRRLRTDIIQWEVKNWGKALDFWQPHLPEDKSTPVLTLGEREGGLTLWLAQQGFHVTSTDLEGVTDAGKELHQRYEVTERITYQSANMLHLPFDDGSMGLVMFKSVLGALSTRENQQQALQEIHRVLKPGGKLLFAENLSGSGFHRGLRKRFVKWSSYWRYLDLREDLPLFDHFESFEFKTHGTLAVLGRSEAQRNVLGYIDGALSPLTPKKSRYILFGAATR